MIGQCTSLCNLWYWSLLQSYVISRSQSIRTHGKILAKALLQHRRVLVLPEVLWGSTGKRNQVSVVTGYPRAYRCKFTPLFLLGSANFLVIPLINEQGGKPDVCSQRHACFRSRQSTWGRGKLPYMVVSRGRGFNFFYIFFFFCPCSAIALRHLRQPSACNTWESIP